MYKYFRINIRKILQILFPNNINYKKIRIINKFIDNSFLFENLEINLEQNISLLKVDIEGFEKFTVQLFDILIKKKNKKYHIRNFSQIRQ